jgi:prepilin-type N-terminal cleavage/methylation domain-containing protein
MSASRGFTLLELLVVIAIIGILSSIVISSVTSARTQAYDAKVKSQLSNIRSSAELYFNARLSYGTATYWASNGTTSNGCQTGMFQDAASGMQGLSLSLSIIQWARTPWSAIAAAAHTPSLTICMLQALGGALTALAHQSSEPQHLGLLLSAYSLLCSSRLNAFYASAAERLDMVVPIFLSIIVADFLAVLYLFRGKYEYSSFMAFRLGIWTA